MDRFVLTDAQWAKMELHRLGKPGDPGRSGSDNRRFVEAVLWIVRTGSPWRDLPIMFGHWNTVFKRFRDWAKADVFKRLFDAVSDDLDMEYAMVDATIGIAPVWWTPMMLSHQVFHHAHRPVLLTVLSSAAEMIDLVRAGRDPTDLCP